MLNDFGDRYVGHGFWCVQIHNLQHWAMDFMVANRSRCVQHLSKAYCISWYLWIETLSMRMKLCLSRLGMTLVWMTSKTCMYCTTRHRTPNTLCALLTRPTLFPQSNPQTPYTMKSIRLRTTITLGLCCLLQCTIIKDKRRINIACFWLWGIVMKDPRKIDVKARRFQLHTKERITNEQWECNMKMRNVQDHKVWKVYEIGLKHLWRC